MDAAGIFAHLQQERPALASALWGVFPVVPTADAPPAASSLAVSRDPGFHVRPEALVQVATALRDDPILRFDFLQNLTAVDWIKTGNIELVYHLFSYQHRHELVLKTSVPREAARLPSLSAIWNNANWLEREQYDLFGVIFEGHPDLRRLLMPDDWVGHPMRKDAREAAEYRGMPTTRASSFDLLLAFDQSNKNKAGS